MQTAAQHPLTRGAPKQNLVLEEVNLAPEDQYISPQDEYLAPDLPVEEYFLSETRAETGSSKASADTCVPALLHYLHHCLTASECANFLGHQVVPQPKTRSLPGKDNGDSQKAAAQLQRALRSTPGHH